MTREWSPDEAAQYEQLLERQKDLLEAQAQLLRLRLQQLRDPTVPADSAADFSRLFVRPKREATVQLLVPLVMSAIDVNGLKGLLPVILAGVLQHVDVERIVSVVGVDADAVEDLVREIQKFISG